MSTYFSVPWCLRDMSLDCTVWIYSISSSRIKHIEENPYIQYLCMHLKVSLRPMTGQLRTRLYVYLVVKAIRLRQAAGPWIFFYFIYTFFLDCTIVYIAIASDRGFSRRHGCIVSMDFFMAVTQAMNFRPMIQHKHCTFIYPSPGLNMQPVDKKNSPLTNIID